MAGTYDEYRGVDPHLCDILVEDILERNKGTSRRLLDIGCGTGSLMTQLAERSGLEITGIDVSQEMLSQARKRYPGGRWILGDFDTKRIPTHFDFVLLSYVIRHLRDQKAALTKARRLLSKGGKLIIVTDDHDQFRESVMHQHVPRIMDIDLNRFPAVVVVQGWLREIGLMVHTHEVVSTRRFAKEEDIEKLIARVRARYISTLTLITDSELKAGADRLERYLKESIKSGPVEMKRVKTIIVGYASPRQS